MAEVARIDLRETESRRNQALEQFRELIHKHPRIKKCQTGTIYLLCFLRAKKFSVIGALEMLEDYLMIRKNFPEWHNKLSLDDSQINYFLESGCMCPLVEKDKLGRQVIFYGCTPFDTVKFKSIDVIRLNALVYANFLQDENIQVGGLVVIYDASILTMQALNAFTISEIHNWFTGIKKGLPMRIKQIHVLNLPQVANIMFKIAFGALGQKIKDRVLIHANQKEFLKNFEEHDILPKEYGGTISWRENNEIYKEHLRKNQEKLLAMDEQFIGDQKDESKSNFGVGDSFVGSFRKLEVD